MLPISVMSRSGRWHHRVTTTELGDLVRRIGAPDDSFLVVQRIPDVPDVFVQVLHRHGEDYALEWRDGAADRHFEVSLHDPDVVSAAMTAWAREDEDWNTGLDARPLDLGPVPDPVPPLLLDDAECGLLEARVREMLAGGYADRRQLAEAAAEYLVSGDRRPVSAEQATELVGRMWRERLAEQVDWQGETDPERLTRAFASLEGAGITARENFACCRNCGQAEIGAVGAPDARGFVYFHSQCTDAAAAGSGLALLYGGFDGSRETTAAIGREVVAAPADAGLPVEWSGDPSNALTVTPLRWQRRLLG